MRKSKSINAFLAQENHLSRTITHCFDQVKGGSFPQRRHRAVQNYKKKNHRKSAKLDFSSYYGKQVKPKFSK